jgi:FkbH-like protein
VPLNRIWRRVDVRQVQDLPWLIEPTAEERERLVGLSSIDDPQLLATLRALVERNWNETSLRSIGRKLRKIFPSDRSSLNQLAQNSGCISLSLLIISTDTVNHLVDALCGSALRVGILLDCRIVEYQQPEAWIAANHEHLASEPPDVTLLALNRNSVQLDQSVLGDPAGAESCVSAALDRISRIAEQLTGVTRRAVVLQTLPPDASDPQLSVDAWLEGSPRRLLAEFNLRLPIIARQQSCAVFDVAAIAHLVGLSHWSAGRFWHLAKMPFAPPCIALYAHRLVQLLAAMQGKSRRVLVLDLDNTLWGGVIGDDGIGGIVLGKGNARGEAFLAIQHLALQYRERGVILCVASKNTEDVALEAFRLHPEMLIRESDIALFQINWEDKPSNIAAMAEALGLGLDSFVFIDDNPVERKELRDALPQIAVPELPDDPSGWVEVIQAAAYFEQTSFSPEDRARTDYYQGNARRAVQAKKIGNHEEFLKSLQMIATVEPFDALRRARIAQLIAKSNQFNLTTRRYSESEIAALETDPQVHTLQVRLQDIFGDNGMISVVICRKHESLWEIESWIMSCRVLGRGLEQAVLGLLVEHARSAGARELRGLYLPTAKNHLVRDHYLKLGFTRTNESAAVGTTWNLSLENYLVPNVPIEMHERSFRSVMAIG